MTPTRRLRHDLHPVLDALRRWGYHSGLATPSDPRTSATSPLLAILISIPLPGLGHFYAGATGRGAVITIGSCIIIPALSTLHAAIAVIAWGGVVGFIGRDAWFCAKAANLKEQAELAAGVAPRRWLVWVWAACRVSWITAIPGLFGVGLMIIAVMNARRAGVLAGLISGAFAFIPLFLVWWAGRETWFVLIGARPASENSLKAEIGTTALVTGICALLIAIAVPAFTGLFRKSAEGGIKNNLGELRQAVERYRRDHDGRSPDSIDAMVVAKTIPVIPALWRRYDGIAHSRTPAAGIVENTATTDSGRWAFVVSPSSPGLTGAIFIDCTHTDTKGSAWSSY